LNRVPVAKTLKNPPLEWIQSICRYAERKGERGRGREEGKEMENGKKANGDIDRQRY
jgi:hypothetical protein